MSAFDIFKDPSHICINNSTGEINKIVSVLIIAQNLTNFDHSKKKLQNLTNAKGQ